LYIHIFSTIEVFYLFFQLLTDLVNFSQIVHGSLTNLRVCLKIILD